MSVLRISRCSTLIVAIVACSSALCSSAHAGCTEREGNATLAAYTRAEKVIDRCIAAVNREAAREACRYCRTARDQLRIANRRAKAFADACGALGVTTEVAELYDATHKIDELNYLIRTEVLDACGG